MHFKKLITDKEWSKLPAPIGILGGTFDPVQKAHIEIARSALRSGAVKSVVLIPAKQNPLKTHAPFINNDDRLSMIELVIADDEGLFVSDIELTSQIEPSYSFTTISEIKKLTDNKASLYFLLGADTALGLPKWHLINELIASLNGFILFPRIQSGQEVKEILSKNFSKEIISKFIELDLEKSYQEISSTKVRAALEQNDIDGLVQCLDEKVISYLRDKKLTI